MKKLLLAAVATAALAVPALAQNQTSNQAPAKAPATQTQPMKQPAQQTQPMNQSAQPGTQAQAGANMQEINPSMLDHQQVRKIQQALDKSGFGAGRTDGIWGPETKAALTKFQKSRNMGTANGQLDSSTLSALKLNPDQFGMSTASSGGMKGAKTGSNAMKSAPGSNSALTGNSTGAANAPRDAANRGMKSAPAESASTNHATGAKPGTAKSTP